MIFLQLQIYNKIPFQQSCCVTAARLLTDSDVRVVGAAGRQVLFFMLPLPCHP